MKKTPERVLAKNRRFYARHVTAQAARKRNYHAERKHDPVYQAMRRRWRGLPEPTRPAPNCCEVCGALEKLVLDHDHNTGRFRGWLCNNCNAGIGFFGDSSDRLVAAARYLRGSELS